MKRSLKDSYVQPATGDRRGVFFGIFLAASSQTLTLAAITVGVAWIPLAILSVFRRGAELVSFLTNYATQTRFLIIIPALILAEPPLRERLDLVVHHFERSLVPRDQIHEFQVEWKCCERLRHSKLVQGLLVLLTYGTARFWDST